MTMDEVIARLQADRDRHLTSDPATESDLRAMEHSLGTPLPAPLRAFFAHFGTGVFYEKHEIFGSRRLMIHDIELVPDILSMHRRLEAEGVAPHLLPVHRAEGAVHFIDLRGAEGSHPVVSQDGARRYPDLPSFLEVVLLAGRS